MKTKNRPRKKPLARFADYIKTPYARQVLLFTGTILAILLLFFAFISPVRYDLTVGMVPPVTIAATKDVVDEITTEKNREAAAAAVQPTYYLQESITADVLNTLDEIFAQLKAVRQYGETLPDMSDTRAFSQEELSYARDMLTAITLRDYQITTLLHTSLEDLDALHNLCYTATQNTMNGHVTQGQETAAVNSIIQIIGFSTNSSLLQNIALPVLKASVKANMVIDEEATLLAQAEAASLVEPVIYKQGQNIVVKGEGRITQSQLSVLSALGLLNDHAVDLNMYLGAALLVLIILVVMCFCLQNRHTEIYGNPKKTLLACIIFVLCFSLCLTVKLIHAYLSVTLLCAMLLTALLGYKTATIMSVSMAVLAAALSAGSSEAFEEVMALTLSVNLVNSLLCIRLMQNKPSRVRTLLVGLAAAATGFLLILSFSMMTQEEVGRAVINALMCAAGGVLSAILFLAFQPLLELIFNLPTQYKLLELCNPEQPLLKRLMVEAPGTYHHSIIVANLAEASAEAIGEGVNPLLARTGGYYHDIGKLMRPSFFRENQFQQVNAHDSADPLTTATIITAHVRDGVNMARAARLPREVVEIIAQHHGDTPVLYFYNKAVENAHGAPVDINAFRYDGHPPTTKEAAVVMLCDTIEAAVRTLENPTADEIESFIIKLVRGKLEDGQLSQSPLTLRDIDRICTACTTVLTGVFHERVKYPEMPAAQHTSGDLLRPGEDAEWEPPKEPVAEKNDPPPEEHKEEDRSLPDNVLPDPEPAPPLAPVELPPVETPVQIDELLAMEEIPSPSLEPEEKEPASLSSEEADPAQTPPADESAGKDAENA